MYFGEEAYTTRKGSVIFCVGFLKIISHLDFQS